MKTILTLWVWLFLSLTSAQAHEWELVEDFFGPKGIPDKKLVYTGEMLELYLENPTMGEMLRKEVQVDIRRLEKSDDKAIFAILLSGKEWSSDWYAFLEKVHGAWKLEAIRTLALTGIFEKIIEEGKDIPEKDDEEEFIYQNAILTLQSDAANKKYLLEHQKVFEEIVNIAQWDEEKALQQAKKLNLWDVWIEEDKGYIQLLIGGVVENTVGFICFLEGGNPPVRGPDRYIYVEHIKGPWYIFKTT